LTYDVVVMGAGLAGLATALEILEHSPALKLAIVGTSLRNVKEQFAGNQPAIATHPHFSVDQNLLSQWTCFALPLADHWLAKATSVDANVCLAKGRWQIAQSATDALHIQAVLDTYNRHVEAHLQGQWHSGQGKYGALWLAGAWAISPPHLKAIWISSLEQLGCDLIDSNDLSAQRPASPIIIWCDPSAVHERYGDLLPMTPWPGQSMQQHSEERSALYGRVTVQAQSYALPLQTSGNWLVRDPTDTTESDSALFKGNRWHAPDRMPFVGYCIDAKAVTAQADALIKHDTLAIPVVKDHLINTGHGSRGLLGAIAGARVIAEMLRGSHSSIGEPLRNAINPNRYVRRALRHRIRPLQSNSQK
jgi:glycine/D-amino acid oxidase-like deaminating enzyme